MRLKAKIAPVAVTASSNVSMVRRFLIAATMITSIAAGHAMAQSYPVKPIRIVTSEVGGGLDFSARLIASNLTMALNQQVVVENRGGAGGAIAIDTGAKAAPDGYTLLMYGSSVWLLPLMSDHVTWNPIKDFAPVTLAIIGANVVVVHPSVPVTSIKELIAFAKSKPGEVTYASAGTGSTSHLAGELFKQMAGVNMTHVPFRGNGPALNAVIGNQVNVVFANVGAGVPHVKSGRLRALAVTSSQPSAIMPELPTVSAAGVPGYESGTIMGIWAPAKTPAAIVAQLNRVITTVLKKPDVKEKFFNTGLETVGSTPKELESTVKTDMVRLDKVVKATGMHSD